MFKKTHYAGIAVLLCAALWTGKASAQEDQVSAVQTNTVSEGRAQEEKSKGYKQHKAGKKVAREQRIADEKAFRRSLKGMPKAERDAAIRARKEAKLKLKPTFTPILHRENMVFFRKKLARNKVLSREEKEEFIYFFEDQYVESVRFRDKRYAEDAAFFEKVTGDAGTTRDQKKEALKRYVEEREAGVRAAMKK